MMLGALGCEVDSSVRPNLGSSGATETSTPRPATSTCEELVPVIVDLSLARRQHLLEVTNVYEVGRVTDKELLCRGAAKVNFGETYRVTYIEFLWRVDENGDLLHGYYELEAR